MPEILFLTRGHGFGHAARDLRVIQELRRRPGTTVRIMANGSAVTYYAMRGVQCTPIELPDEDYGEDFGEGAAKAVWRALASVPRPDLVVSDEVMWALPFAREVWKRPCVMLLCALWAEYGMPDADRFFDTADEVLVLDFPRNRRESYGTTAPIGFLGPVVQPFPAGRGAARSALGIAERDEVAVLSLGGMNTRPESRRMATAAIGAWRAHAGPGARLLLLADPPAEPLPVHDGDGAPAGGGEVVWAGVTPEPETYYRAADVVLNDAMGSTVCDLAWNGVPAVALLDEESAAGFPKTFPGRIRHLTAAGLIETAPVHEGPPAVWRAIERARAGAAAPDRAAAREGFGWSTGETVAQRLFELLDA
ncbi:glycosyl transferase [Streptomyces sp. NPDC001985]|uniref:glycosyl transferase n=1 Tax=Streptomyces sp. NPDC001985 TaxID=3154406 RepID=UPI00332F32D8